MRHRRAAQRQRDPLTLEFERTENGRIGEAGRDVRVPCPARPRAQTQERRPKLGVEEHGARRGIGRGDPEDRVGPRIAGRHLGQGAVCGIEDRRLRARLDREADGHRTAGRQVEHGPGAARSARRCAGVARGCATGVRPPVPRGCLVPRGPRARSRDPRDGAGRRPPPARGRGPADRAGSPGRATNGRRRSRRRRGQGGGDPWRGRSLASRPRRLDGRPEPASSMGVGRSTAGRAHRPSRSRAASSEVPCRSSRSTP